MNVLQAVKLQVLDLEPWSFEVTGKKPLVITGPSGSGKSRLLRALADMDDHAGEVLLNNASCQSMAANSWRKQVGLMSAESAWWYDQVGEHFASYKIDWLEQLGFDKTVMGWEVSRLSTGEKQRLALLRLLVNQPKALLLDEPTANLDQSMKLAMEKLIVDYCQQNAVACIWVSHDAEQQTRLHADVWRINAKHIEQVAA